MHISVLGNTYDPRLLVTLILPPPVVLYAACCTINKSLLTLPSSFYMSLVIHRIHFVCHKLYLQKRNASSMHLFLVNHDIPIDQYIIEQEELSWLGFLPAHFRQDPFTHQDSAGYRERLWEQHSTMSHRYEHFRNS